MSDTFLIDTSTATTCESPRTPKKRECDTNVDLLQNAPATKKFKLADSDEVTPWIELPERSLHEHVMVVFAKFFSSTIIDRPFAKYWIPTDKLTDDEWLLLNLADGELFHEEWEHADHLDKQQYKLMDRVQMFVNDFDVFDHYLKPRSFKPTTSHHTLCFGTASY